VVGRWECVKTRERFPRAVGSCFCFPQPVISTAFQGCLGFVFGLWKRPQVAVDVVLGLFDSLARDVELKDDAMMNQPINGCRRGHRVLEDAFHLEKGRLLEMNTLPRSYRWASRVNSTSISSQLCCTSPGHR
jgi:hypothetical protein